MILKDFIIERVLPYIKDGRIDQYNIELDNCIINPSEIKERVIKQLNEYNDDTRILFRTKGLMLEIAEEYYSLDIKLVNTKQWIDFITVCNRRYKLDNFL